MPIPSIPAPPRVARLLAGAALASIAVGGTAAPAGAAPGDGTVITQADECTAAESGQVDCFSVHAVSHQTSTPGGVSVDVTTTRSSSSSTDVAGDPYFDADGRSRLVVVTRDGQTQVFSSGSRTVRSLFGASCVAIDGLQVTNGRTVRQLDGGTCPVP